MSGGGCRVRGKGFFFPHPPCGKGKRQKQVLNSLGLILSLLLGHMIEVLWWLPREASSAAAQCWSDTDAELHSQ